GGFQVCLVFFFQAEDGIRDLIVTGVQTCALPILCAEQDDPYAAMAELGRRPLVYRAMILSLNGLYREELPLVRAVKRHWPHIEKIGRASCRERGEIGEDGAAG